MSLARAPRTVRLLPLLLSIALAPRAHATLVWSDNWKHTTNDLYLGQSCNGHVEPMSPLSCGTPYAPPNYWSFESTDYNSVYCDSPAGGTTTGMPGCWSLDTTNGILWFHGEQRISGATDGGWPMIANTSYFQPTSYISVETTYYAHCACDVMGCDPSFAPNPPNCTAGLTIYDGEEDYREIGYVSLPPGYPTSMSISRIGPTAATTAPMKYIQPDETHRLRLDYYGDDANKRWVYFIDDVVWYAESAPMYSNARPSIAMFFTAYEPYAFAEGAVTAPLNGWNGDVIDQAPLTTAQRTDGYAATTTTWYAQAVAMSGSALDRVKLYLAVGTFRVLAYTDNNNSPGTLINDSGSWIVSTEGFQYVPLRVPSHYSKVWIEVRGNSAGNFGTTGEGVKPYPYDLKATTNSGATWTTVNRNLWFETHRRG